MDKNNSPSFIHLSSSHYMFHLENYEFDLGLKSHGRQIDHFENMCWRTQSTVAQTLRRVCQFSSFQLKEAPKPLPQLQNTRSDKFETTQ